MGDNAAAGGGGYDGHNSDHYLLDEAARLSEVARELQDSASDLISRTWSEEQALRQCAIALDYDLLCLRPSLCSASKSLSSDPKFAEKETCPSVKNILILDSEGKRVAVKYYADDWATHAAKLAFEKSVFTKTQKTNARTEAEIAMFDGYIVVYKFIQDLHFFVTGGDNENELILATVLQGFFEAVALILRNNVDKRTALENLDLILLCLDEIVDRGIILETEASVIAGKTSSDVIMEGISSLSEQTISQALATAREHLARSLLK